MGGLFRSSGEEGEKVSKDINETRLAMSASFVVCLEFSIIQSLKRILNFSHTLFCHQVPCVITDD